jgi:WD40 repeat protein
MWDVATGERLHRLACPHGAGAVLRYSPDGKRLVSGTEDGALQFWDAATGKRIGQCRGPQELLTAIAFTEGDKILAAAASRHRVVLWEAPSGRVLTPRGGHDAPVTSLAFSRDGKTVWSSDGVAVRRWDLGTGKEAVRVEPQIAVERFTPGASPCLLSPDGRWLAWEFGIGRLLLAEADSGERVAELQGYTDEKGAHAAFAPDGSAVAAVERTARDGDSDWLVMRVWDLSTWEERRTIRTPGTKKDGYLSLGRAGNALALSPEGKMLALGLWSGGGNEPSQTFLWDVADGKQIAELPGDAAAGPMAFSPDGSLLATVCGDGAVRLWDTANGKEVRSLGGEKDRVSLALVFSPDGRTLAVAGYGHDDKPGSVRLWELASGKVRAEFAGHGSAVLSLAFSPDGRTLATGGADTTVLLWDLTGRTELGARSREKPTAEELASLWSDLDGDARKAHRAMARLAAAPTEALALLQKELKRAPGEPLTDREVARLIADLDDDSFDRREKASRALEQAGRRVRPTLLQALEGKPGAEAKRRLHELLEAISIVLPTADEVRPLRGVELLERLGTPGARRLLQALADGNADARLTADARAALRRLPREP